MVTDPYQIFARARARWQAQRYPARLDYTIAVTARESGRPVARHYRARWDASTNAVVMNPVSIEERTDPYHPAGGFNFYGWSIGGPRKGTGTRGDLIGVPLLAPNYSFGLARYEPPSPRSSAQIVEEVRREFHDPAPRKIARLQAHSGLKTIAIMNSTTSDYRIALDGIVPFANHEDYHLSLVPARDPKRFRLRQAWIDVRTYDLDRLLTAGNFTDGRTESVAWAITFTHAAGVTYIARERAQGSLAAPYGGHYASYSVRFEQIAPAQGSMFAPIIGGTVLREPADS